MDHQKLNLSGIKQGHKRIISRYKYSIYKQLADTEHRLYKLMSVKNSHFLPRSLYLTYKALLGIIYRIYRVITRLGLYGAYSCLNGISYDAIKTTNGVLF